ncbi:adhesion G-protein coupled receptor G1-like [Polymixia lowei]
MPPVTLLLSILMCFSTFKAKANYCENLIQACHNVSDKPWTRCYEERITTCTTRGRLPLPNFIRLLTNTSHEAEESPTHDHRVHIPSSALQRGRGDVPIGSEENVLVVITVLDSSLFMLSPPPRSRSRGLDQFAHREGTVMGQLVLAVRVGNHAVNNLPQPITLTFKHNKQANNGTCVFWQESSLFDGTGHWSTEGCDTSYNTEEFICTCNHLSFFAVLVNPKITIDHRNAANLSYITYTGSGLSVIFTIISLVIYICLQRRRPEKSISLHMQLTGALFCLHLSFLLSNLWAWLEEEEEEWGCRVLGLLLHWSLLATFSWTALEGFHLYLLLVKVFNIYVRRYLLKLCLVGWGVPSMIAGVCWFLGVYGKHTLPVSDPTNHSAPYEMCWIKTSSQEGLLVSIVMVTYMGLVLLFNSTMLGLVVVKLWRLRGNTGGREGSSGWTMDREKRARLCKNCATILGLSCVLGLAWGLAFSTYSFPLPGLYLFTILNSLQGVFMFLWSLALTCKSQSDNNSSVKDPSTQKMMETSFKN